MGLRGLVGLARDGQDRHCTGPLPIQIALLALDQSCSWRGLAIGAPSVHRIASPSQRPSTASLSFLFSPYTFFRLVCGVISAPSSQALTPQEKVGREGPARHQCRGDWRVRTLFNCISRRLGSWARRTPLSTVCAAHLIVHGSSVGRQLCARYIAASPPLPPHPHADNLSSFIPARTFSDLASRFKTLPRSPWPENPPEHPRQNCWKEPTCRHVVPIA